jgi:hypothetical protein
MAQWGARTAESIAALLSYWGYLKPKCLLRIYGPDFIRTL